MQDYGEIYCELMKEVERAIKLLGCAQLKAEEIYMKIQQSSDSLNFTNDCRNCDISTAK